MPRRRPTLYQSWVPPILRGAGGRDRVRVGRTRDPCNVAPERIRRRDRLPALSLSNPCPESVRKNPNRAVTHGSTQSIGRGAPLRKTTLLAAWFPIISFQSPHNSFENHPRRLPSGPRRLISRPTPDFPRTL